MRTEFVFLGHHKLKKPHSIIVAFDRVRCACRSETAGTRRQDHANFLRKSRKQIAKIPEFWRAHLANVRSTNLVTSLQLSVKSMICSDPNKCASDVEIMQNLRKKKKKNAKNFAKELQNFRNFGAPCAQNSFISASRRCATRMTSLKLSDGSTMRPDPKSRRAASRSRKYYAKILRRNCKIYRNSAALRKTNCVHSAIFRFKKSRNVAADLSKVRSLFISEKVRV